MIRFKYRELYPLHILLIMLTIKWNIMMKIGNINEVYFDQVIHKSSTLSFFLLLELFIRIGSVISNNSYVFLYFMLKFLNML